MRHSCETIRLPGPPLTEKSAIAELLLHNITVGIGILESWSARNTRFDCAWVCASAHNFWTFDDLDLNRLPSSPMAKLAKLKPLPSLL